MRCVKEGSNVFFVGGTTLNVLWVAAVLSLAAQDVLPSRTTASVRTLPTFAALAPAPQQTELTVRWVVAAPPAVAGARVAAPPMGVLMAPGSLPEVNRFEIQRRTVIVEAPVRERDPQIGPDDLVIVAVNVKGQEVGWQPMRDPRIMRSEHPDATGKLSGQVLHRSETDLIIRVPDGAAVSMVRVYAVQWNGREFLLRGLGTIPISR